MWVWVQSHLKSTLSYTLAHLLHLEVLSQQYAYKCITYWQILFCFTVMVATWKCALISTMEKSPTPSTLCCVTYIELKATCSIANPLKFLHCLLGHVGPKVTSTCHFHFTRLHPQILIPMPNFPQIHPEYVTSISPTLVEDLKFFWINTTL